MDNPKKGKKQSKFNKYFRWPLIVLVLSFSLSMAFGVLSEVALDGAGIAISIVVIVVFLVIAILTDMIGVAITSCDEKNFRAMASRKVRGAKEAIWLQKRADRVSSIVADILGDICSILSGAAGAAVATALIRESMTGFMQIVVASLVSAVIAALLISGKAFMKRYSMVHADQIILIIGKILSIFHISKKNKGQKKNTKNKASDNADVKTGEEQISENDVKAEDLDSTTKAEDIDSTVKNIAQHNDNVQVESLNSEIVDSDSENKDKQE